MWLGCCAVALGGSDLPRDVAATVRRLNRGPDRAVTRMACCDPESGATTGCDPGDVDFDALRPLLEGPLQRLDDPWPGVVHLTSAAGTVTLFDGDGGWTLLGVHPSPRGRPRFDLDLHTPGSADGVPGGQVRRACLGQHDPHPVQGVLTIATSSDATDLIGPLATSAIDHDILDAITLPLVRSSFDCRLDLTPGLARSWQLSPDGRTLQMTLRDDIRFSDGQPVTTADVAFTWDLIADPVVASPRISSAEALVGGGPRVMGPDTLVWSFRDPGPASALLAQINVPIAPQHLLHDADRPSLRGHRRVYDPLASGPFVVEARQPGEIVLGANPWFTGSDEDRARVAQIRFVTLPGAEARLEALLDGQVDLVAGILPVHLERIAAQRPDLRRIRRGWRAMDYIGWNNEVAPFDDPGVRRALTMAIDIDAAMAAVLPDHDGQPLGRRAVGTITPELCDLQPPELPVLPYDRDAARALLAEAGWRATPTGTRSSTETASRSASRC